MTRLSALFFLLLACTAQAETWRFAVIGDTPYNNYERQKLPAMLNDIAAEHPEFIIHAGDFKRSNARCTDELFVDRHALFNDSAVPFFYVPGDNEWTDCRRVIAGHYNPLERLDKLRELFFSTPRSLGKTTLPLERQNGRPEHLRWRLGPALFISLNVPGPNNNFGPGRIANPEFTERNPKLISWMKEGFSKARQEEKTVVVIAMQGNPGMVQHAAGMAHSGYRELLDALLLETRSFNGHVLLIHGDTHWQRIDQPLRDPVTHQHIPNFTRLETFGYPFMGWVKVIIDSDDPARFRFEVRPRHSHWASP